MAGPDTRIIIEDLIYVAGCGFALWKGGRPERIVAGTILLSFVISLVVSWTQRKEDPHYITLMLDFIVLASVLYAAFTSNLKWPLIGSALQILSITAHITRIIDPTIHSWAYVTVGIALGYGLVLATVYGAIRRMSGGDPDR